MTSPALLAESYAVRALLVDEVLDAGGVISWLQQRVAGHRPIAAAEALAWLDVAQSSGTALTTDHLTALARATSAGPWQGSPNPAVTVLYSHGTAWGTATALAENDPDAVRIIDHSHVGQLLASSCTTSSTVWTPSASAGRSSRTRERRDVRRVEASSPRFRRQVSGRCSSRESVAGSSRTGPGARSWPSRARPAAST